MKITKFQDEQSIVAEIGSRIKQQRISMNITRKQFAAQCGLSNSTLARIENGSDPQWSTIVKILSNLDLADNLNMLIPEPQPDYKAIFENKPNRKRARPKATAERPMWIWGDDKEAKTK